MVTLLSFKILTNFFKILNVYNITKVFQEMMERDRLRCRMGSQISYTLICDLIVWLIPFSESLENNKGISVLQECDRSLSCLILYQSGCKHLHHQFYFLKVQFSDNLRIDLITNTNTLQNIVYRVHY